MNCEYVKRHLDTYLDGEFKNASAAEKIRKHLDVCTPCRKAFNVQRELKLACAAIKRDLPSPYLETRILAAVAAKKRENFRSGMLRIAFSGAFVAIFALFVWVGVPALTSNSGSSGIEYAELPADGSILATGDLDADDLIRFAMGSHLLVQSEMDGLKYAASDDDFEESLEIGPERDTR